MKNIMKLSIVLMMCLTMFSGVSVQAQEVNTITLGSGDNAVTFEPGTYTVGVAMKKATAISDNSMAASAISNAATLLVKADGSATITMVFKSTTINGLSGAARDIYTYDAHSASGSTTSVTVNSTYNFKPLYSSYTMPGSVSFDVNFENQNGVYMGFEIQTSFTTMDQEAYMLFDYSAHKADYSELNKVLASFSGGYENYSATSWLRVATVLDTIEYTLDSSKQAIVDGYTSELSSAVAQLEKIDGRVESTVSATAPINEASYMLEVPSEIRVGEVSFEEDTQINYEISLEVLEGNVEEDYSFEVSSATNGTLTNDKNVLAYTNTLGTQYFTKTQTNQASFVIAKEDARKVSAGTYQGEVVFSVRKISE